MKNHRSQKGDSSSRIEHRDKDKKEEEGGRVDDTSSKHLYKSEDVETVKQNSLPNPSTDKCHPTKGSQETSDELLTGLSSEKAKQKSQKLHPFVHWAQSSTHISLRVDLSQVENIEANINEEGINLEFSAQGKGAHGLKDYSFSLDFYSQVDRKFECHPIGQYVLILIKKEIQQTNWPRLTNKTSKLPWLRVDFDRYEGDSSDENFEDNSEDNYADDDDNDKSTIGGKEQSSLNQLYQKFQEDTKKKIDEQSDQDKRNSWSKSLDKIFKNSNKNFDIFNPFNKKTSFKNKSSSMKYDYRREGATMDTSKNTAKHALDYKKTYLFVYNLIMFIVFLKVFIVLAIKGLSGTIDDDIVQGTAFIVKLLTYTQLLETIHPMLGLVPGGPLMPFTQVIGRILVNYFLTESFIRIDSAPFAHHLFLVWSSIEIFRYSFYALRVFKVNIYALTWCRYTLFLPLYPMGGFCESMVLLSTIRYYEKTGQYSLSLPNSANISFSLPFMLRIYIFVLLGPTIYILMKYMWRQRSKQLKEKVA